MFFLSSAFPHVLVLSALFFYPLFLFNFCIIQSYSVLMNSTTDIFCVTLDQGRVDEGSEPFCHWSWLGEPAQGFGRQKEQQW